MPLHSFACSCYRGEDEYKVLDEDAEYVFIGELKKKKLFSPAYTFTIKNTLKGSPKDKISIVSKSPCAQKFKKNILYFVYAYDVEGVLETSRCSSWNAELYEEHTSKAIKYYEQNH